MLWVVYQSEFAQLSAAVPIWHPDKLGCMGPPFAVALMLHTTLLIMAEKQCCTWHSD